MKKKICIVTATRAEYGLLKPVMDKIASDPELLLQIIATGMHLSPEFGFTYREIEEDGFIIDEKVEIQMSSDSPVGISKTMGLAMIGFSDVLARLKPDMLVILGDRYEIFSVASVAVALNIPIAHMYGGETTEGAFDEAFRHAISKMSYLHFTSTEAYRKRVIQLGEHPDRVFNVGAIGVENIKKVKLLSKEELEEQLQFNLDGTSAIVTFHSVTLENDTAEIQFGEVLKALDDFVDLKIIFTKANSDTYGRVINNLIEEYVMANANKTVAVASLGTIKYLSALNCMDLVIGNSSSGLVEAPSFHIPTVNIGDRQKGRTRANTVIDCKPHKEDIKKSIEKALSTNFKEQCKESKNPYKGEDTSEKIYKCIKDCLFIGQINLKKKFFDV